LALQQLKTIANWKIKRVFTKLNGNRAENCIENRRSLVFGSSIIDFKITDDFTILNMHFLKTNSLNNPRPSLQPTFQETKHTRRAPRNPTKDLLQIRRQDQ
jgi:hypothetical protein